MRATGNDGAGASMLREIVLDTETTGLDARKGDRLIEIGAIELMDRIPTGVEFHRYLNPDRVVSPEAIAVHGITNELLVDKPRFADVVDEFLAFIGETQLVIHNATFDIGFINAELERLSKPPIKMSRVVDTLQLARRKHPAGPNSLDALCKRYAIDNSKRDKHGAIVDSLLLVEVYVELLGERQASLGLASRATQEAAKASTATNGQGVAKQRTQPLPSRLTQNDLMAHAALIDSLGPSAAWKKFSD
jgi:DNA polymerase-3 subunit epsilon